MDRNHPTTCPSMTNLLRARRAPQITLQYPLQQALHSKPQISYILTPNQSTYG